jgi:hypothetical protein
MGAEIILCGPHRATVVGLDRKVVLKGISMTSPDIRAGMALLIAALSADGVSKIYNIEQIDRGYQNIEHRLNALGAKIHTVKTMKVPAEDKRPGALLETILILFSSEKGHFKIKVVCVYV